MLKMRNVVPLLFYLLIVMVVLLSACAQTIQTDLPLEQSTTEESTAEEPTAEEPVDEEPAADELTKIRMAVLPVLELTPIYVAMQEGIMAKNGIEVEMIPVSSGQEKDQLLAIAEADCGQAEHLSVILPNQEEITQQNITGSFLSSESHPIFSIIAGANSGIETLEDLKGVEIGTSEATVNEYVATRILQKNGFSDEDIKYLAVPRIPDRMALLESGELKAASLPTHLGLMVVKTQGARIIADDGQYPGLMEATWSCRKKFIDENPEAIKGFVAAIGEAVEIINEDPQKYKGLAVENGMIPGPIVDTYLMPKFPAPFVPSKEAFIDTYQWAIERGLVSNEDVAYEDTVRPEFIP